MKFLLKLVVFLVAIVVLAVGATVFYVDRLAKTGIEKGGTYALGVSTSVDGVGIGLLSGSFSVDGLEVANPAGFSDPSFVRLGAARLEVPPQGLMEQTIRVPLLSFDGISVNLERSGGKSNYDAILQSLKKFESGEKPAEAPAEGGKTFIIDELRITDVSAKVTYALLGASKSTVSVVVPEIRLKNVGSGSGGVGLGEIASVVTKALLQAIAQAGIVPADILKDLTSGLRGLANVKIDLPEGVEGVAGKLLSGDTDAAVEELGKQAKEKLGKKLDEATGGQAEDLGKTIEGIGSLLGGKKKAEEGK